VPAAHAEHPGGGRHHAHRSRRFRIAAPDTATPPVGRIEAEADVVVRRALDRNDEKAGVF
jgi:hypothetical protein